MDDGRRLLTWEGAMVPSAMDEMLRVFASRYKNLEIGSIGRSILGRNIPCLRLGHGARTILYVGAHHGMEGITATVLLRFVNEYEELLEGHGRVGGIDVGILDEMRTIYVVPMLNPDGVDVAVNGVPKDHILYDRLFRMNGESDDFSRWQANARGVDLNHNYDAGFAAYKTLEAAAGILGGAPTRYSGEGSESEPETAALCRFVRFIGKIEMALTLHTQGGEIYCTSGEKTAKNSLSIGKKLAALTGYRLSRPTGMAAYGGFTDWFIETFDRPSFTIECGRGENPLPPSDFPAIYLSLRDALFTAPTLL